MAEAVVELRARGAEALQSTLKKSQSAFSQFQQAAETATTKTSAGFTMLSSGLGRLVVAYAGFRAIRGATNEIIESEKASLALRGALTGTDAQINTNAARIEKWADALSQKIALDDEEIVNLATFAASLGVTGDRIEEVTQKGIALAKALRLPSQIGVRAVALQTQGGSIGRVRQLIPQFEDLSDTKIEEALSEKAAVGMKILEAEAAGLGGSLDRLKISFGNLIEAGGKLAGNFFPLTDVISTFASWIGSAASGLASLAGITDPTASSLEDVGDSAGQAASSVNVFAAEVAKLEDKLQKEIDMFGKSSAEVARYELSLRGATTAQLANVTAKEQQIAALKREAEVNEAVGKKLREAEMKAITAGMTPEEKERIELGAIGGGPADVARLQESQRRAKIGEAAGELLKMNEELDRQIGLFGLSEDAIKAETAARTANDAELGAQVRKKQKELDALNEAKRLFDASATPIDNYRKSIAALELVWTKLNPQARALALGEAQKQLDEAMMREAEQELEKKRKFRVDLEFGTVGLTDFNQRIQQALLEGSKKRKEDEEAKKMVEEQKKLNGLTGTANEILTRIEQKVASGGMTP